VNLLELLRVKVFVVDAPLVNVSSEVVDALFVFFNTCHLVFLNCRDYFFEAVHFGFYHRVYVVDMLQCGLFQVNEPLLRISNLSLHNSLSTKDIRFDLIKRCVLRPDLFSHHRRLVVKINLILFLSPLDDLVHSVETFLDLLHQASLTVKPNLLIRLELLHKVD
jgi:hypothetical protein